MKPILKPISTGTHIQIKNILFTTDFSDAAKAAAPYAAALAKRYGAKLYALHVRSPIVNTLTLPENWRALEKIAEIEAQREKFALVHTFAGMHPEILINEGDLWPNIKAAIQERHRHDRDGDPRALWNRKIPAGLRSRRDFSAGAVPRTNRRA